MAVIATVFSYLSRIGSWSFVFFGVITMGIVYVFYRHNVKLSMRRVQERVRSIAATGALQFDQEDLNELRTIDDIQKPQYKKVIDQLNEIRKCNIGVRYIYIMRPTIDPGILEFIADADSIDPYAEKDLNNDGIIDEEDELRAPGDSYDISALPEFLNLNETSVSAKPAVDQWGTWIAGQAPIFDENGVTIAVLGVDVDVQEVQRLTYEEFMPRPLRTFQKLFLPMSDKRVRYVKKSRQTNDAGDTEIFR